MTPTTTTKKPIVVFGPSGTGKSTLLKRLFAEYPNEFGFSVSNTTRNPRAGEINGKDYHFLTNDEFLAAIERNEFIEHAEFSGNRYGTTIQAVKDVADSGKVCILDIDVQGVKSVKRTDLGARFIFVAPPSEEELERRLRSRGTDDETSILKRLQAAKTEIEYGNQEGSCDIKVINDDIDAAYNRLVKFIFV
ncbi:guanylate kinase [Coemansia sp. RSA 1813]|nr:guanylate kinase [Coemansia sp. RSA 1646]KAJ1771533.1 guanylate kinase [Coemansia sp. RSA 1843]KAJ2571541.1 guanylate kinase [Coemansia sp. RSA 1813]